MATIVYPDGREEETQPVNGSDFSLEELQRIVQGYIEVIPCPDGRIMVCNEESKILGLDRNDKATELAGLPSPEERRQAIANTRKLGIFVINTLGPDEEDFIAGTVLVCKDSEVR